MPETYTQFTWVDGSGGGTPVTAANLNAMTAGIESMDDRLTAVESGALNPSGVVADYTGRYGTPGSGTDNRAALQTALNAASSLVGGDASTRRSVTVRLAPGHYVFTAPATSGPSLTIPVGVVLDAADATLYFDYPATARVSWCAIEVSNAAHMRVGKVYVSGRNSPPAAGSWYDAIRLVQTDGNSRITGYSDSRIQGFQGAAIRGVGAWISYIAGITFSRCDYGYVASNVGTAYGYTVVNGDGNGERTHTDLRIIDCHFVNLSHGGFLGTVAGDTGAVHDSNYDFLGLTLGFYGCVFEQIGTPAIYAVSAATVVLVDTAFEECGNTSGGMNVFDNCMSITVSGLRTNLAGGSAPVAGGGTVQPSPDFIFQLDSVRNFILDGAYIFNSFAAGMTLSDNAPMHGFRVSGVETEGEPADGFMFFGDGMTSVSGAWNGGHLTIGNHHLWQTAAGVLRHKNGAPTSETDGTTV